MKKNHLLPTAALGLFLSALPAPAALTVLHSWSMGDAEGGTAGNPAALMMVDTVGGINLTRTGSPLYTATGGTGALGVDFNNTGSAHNVTATEYYSSATGNVNPPDIGRWGIEALVRIDLVPAANQELGVFELGGGSSGIIIETFGNGAWAIHQSNVEIQAATSPVKAGQTQHLAAVRNGGKWELYIDGLLATSFAAVADYDPAAGIRIGAGNAGNGDNRGFNGAISAARVFGYTGAFNINETLYAVPEPTTFTGLLAAGSLMLARRRRRRPAGAR